MAIATGAAAVLLLAGCTSQSEPAADGHTDHGHDTGQESGHNTSHDGSGANPGPGPGADAGTHNGDDVAFAQHMIPHHSQAVEMVDILLAKPDVDPRVVTLAEQIRAAQAPEIEQMQGWLDQWGNPPMPAMDHSSMDGMVAPADIEKLREAPGPEATKLFLEQMIGHHEGAVTMAQSEIDGGQYPQAVDLARAIIDSQQKEIDEMKSILNSL
ncbi:DUF305 domain-containing protein [Mycolicibacterium neoaurum]|uniref:DUF305 domain-containing protein n=1 Tax=Mycolicibacterium neoaurum TaxID=1795 RepID=UPI002673A6CD|nr:DUF305 domain-containing protein [Mycolicibacterium neoaurum]MDO3403253.1 DUF305 domain-containing protein [Mycolicibacterium neoaurum]